MENNGEQKESERRAVPLVDAQVDAIDWNIVVEVKARQSHPNLVAIHNFWCLGE